MTCKHHNTRRRTDRKVAALPDVRIMNHVDSARKPNWPFKNQHHMNVYRQIFLREAAKRGLL